MVVEKLKKKDFLWWQARRKGSILFLVIKFLILSVLLSLVLLSLCQLTPSYPDV